ncbi:MAG: fibronectin type III domain-containing protein [Acidobacteriales bacterium]|nr:fibronectin type III domain-containing protein [Terriglobales bacterium]
MKRTVLTLLIAFALGSWSLAQTEQTQTSDTNKSSSANGIESGPTVDASDHSATIRWQTQDRAATVVKYGTDKNNLDKQARHSGGARDHNVTLAELKPGTKYFYQIQKNSGEVRAEGEFTTKGSGESAGGSGNQGGNKGGSGEDNVVITEGPTVQPGADGNAKIVWKTDDVAATDVKYGTDPNNLQQRAYKPGGSRNHEADLKNLQAGQTYHYQVLRRDGSVRTTGQFQYQPQAASTTPAAPGQTASGQQGSVQITGGPWLDTVADNQAIVTWITNTPASSVVRYGTDRSNLDKSANSPWGGNHAVTLSGLKPNTTYYFQVETGSGAGQLATKSNVGGFQTLAPGAQAKKGVPIAP